MPESDDQSVANNKTAGVQKEGGGRGGRGELEVRGSCSK